MRILNIGVLELVRWFLRFLMSDIVLWNLQSWRSHFKCRFMDPHRHKNPHLLISSSTPLWSHSRTTAPPSPAGPLPQFYRLCIRAGNSRGPASCCPPVFVRTCLLLHNWDGGGCSGCGRRISDNISSFGSLWSYIQLQELRQEGKGQWGDLYGSWLLSSWVTSHRYEGERPLCMYIRLHNSEKTHNKLNSEVHRSQKHHLHVLSVCLFGVISVVLVTCLTPT